MKQFTTILCLTVFLMALPALAQKDAPTIILNPHGHTAAIRNLHFTDNGNSLISVSEDKSILVWDVVSGEIIKSYYSEIGPGHEGVFYASAISKDGRYLAVGGYPAVITDSNYVIIIDLKNDKQYGVAIGHYGTITDISISHDNSILATADDNGEICLWDLTKGGTLEKLSAIQYEYPISSLSFANTTPILSVAASTNEIYLYSLSGDKVNNPSISKTLKRHKKPVSKVLYSPNDKFLCSIDISGGITLWNKGGYLMHYQESESIISDLSFSHDELYMTCAIGTSGEAIVIELRDGYMSNSKMFTVHGNPITSCDFNPQSKYGREYLVATSSEYDNQINIWSAFNGQKIKALSSQSGQISSMVFGVDGNLYLSKGITSNTGNLNLKFDLTSFDLYETNTTKSKVSKFNFESSIQLTDDYELITASGKYISVDPLLDGVIQTWTETLDGNVVVGTDLSLKLFSKDGDLLKEFIGHSSSIKEVTTNTDGRYIASLSDDQTIIIWNLKDESSVPSISDALNLNYPDQSQEILDGLSEFDTLLYIRSKQAWVTVIQELKLNKVKFYRELESLRELGHDILSPFLTFFISEDLEWVCWDQSGYFSCSENGDEYFGWHFGNGIQQLADFRPARQYFDILYKPGWIEKSYQSGKCVADLLKISGQKLFDFSKLKYPPFARIELLDMEDVVLENGKYLTSKRKINLIINAYHEGSGIKEINVHRNKKLVKTISSSELIEINKSGDGLLSVEVDMGNGVNEFMVIAKNFDDVDSKLDKVDIEYVGEQILTANLYIISVGINDYKNPSMNLNYAYSDSKSIVAALYKSDKKLYNNIYSYQLSNEQATREGILNSFEEVSKVAKSNDVFVFYFAGHGFLKETDAYESEYYLVPHEVTNFYSDDENLTSNGITTLDLIQRIESINCSKQLMLLDACQSGSAVATFAMRGVGQEEKRLHQLSRKSGVTLIAASGASQYATEFKDLGHGVFTYALLEAFAGKAETGINDSKVSVMELVPYLLNRIPELSLKYNTGGQKPNIFSQGSDFVVGVTTN